MSRARYLTAACRSVGERAVRRRFRGYTLIEILVTMVILTFGLLGAAGLQTRMLAEDDESLQRAQAVLLLEDMLNRISANRIAASDYLLAGPVGTGETSSCAASGTLAQRDLCEWSEMLRGRGEISGGTRVGAMLSARGCIEEITGTSPTTLRVSIAWQGMTRTAAPSLGCARDEYGDDRYRRLVSSRITIGVLQ